MVVHTFYDVHNRVMSIFRVCAVCLYMALLHCRFALVFSLSLSLSALFAQSDFHNMAFLCLGFLMEHLGYTRYWKPSPLMHHDLPMFRLMIAFNSCFTMGKAHMWGMFPKCKIQPCILGMAPPLGLHSIQKVFNLCSKSHVFMSIGSL